ncbi:hypothetical protein [Legionella hackeliae]|uniref:Uncharacterized protein n=1 Tax=Legionella hackeliae TaxID=449 RepID=A0A0A8URE3_LEGHA|nr:hypothetical protein [Legionella hackeliae]KTD15315.1 hypothetical protein Lhac_0157 [Legionella hackeliae]CEK11318.1 conserved protein of unknown function [Legionella hackeliae]STX48088.1 Uncharacterised protein [Legionella hackeliae]
MTTINEEEAFQVIKKFNVLNASRAPISDFVGIIDLENFELRLRGSDIFFKGIAGFADHQIGKLIYFDQSFDCELQSSQQEGNKITVATKGVWYAKTWQSPAAYSQQLIADLTHTWELEKKTNGALLIVVHICETFAYRKGHAPGDIAKDFHLELK